MIDAMLFLAAAAENINPATASAMDWFIAIGVIIGPISVIYSQGKKEGVQAEKNKDYDKRIKKNEANLNVIKEDLDEIKTDVAFIKGQLVATDHIEK